MATYIATPWRRAIGPAPKPDALGSMRGKRGGMCGINGVFHYAGGVADAELLERQSLAQKHRGPDDRGLWQDGPVGLAMRRLAVIDLSPGGHQPMPNEDESLWVVYNGELYGWPEIRAGLARRGHRFRGHSDTEAFLHLYEERGLEMFELLRGMFTFGLYDQKQRRLILGRDRMGIKPLYWHDDGRRVAFASELKALMLDPTIPRDVECEAIASYLSFQYVPGPRTIWRGVRRLRPGHYLVVDERGAREAPYWELPAGPAFAGSEEEAIETLREHLAEAVKLRLVADVPLGAFLSGGVDSSAVVALMAAASDRPVRTFSIGFEEEGWNELEHARRVANHLGTDHTEHVVQPRALEDLPRVVWALDEPFADASMLPTLYVSEMARSHVTVALSGDGGDEMYGGYDTYGWAQRYAAADRTPRALRRLAAMPARALPSDNALGRKLARLPLTVADRHLGVTAFFPPRELSGVLGTDLRAAVAGFDPWAEHRAIHAEAARSEGEIAALLHLDARTYMVDDVLVKVDRTSMQHSLEVRVPLLDHRVVEFVSRLPFGLKRRDGVSKWILRQAVKELLPAETLARRKQGFAVPLERWLGVRFDTLAREVLLDPGVRDRGWIDQGAVERLLARTHLREKYRANRLWALVCLELWAQAYVDRPREAFDTPAVALAEARS
jgi:asparagine synthase (glutamine-hydrolysing)